MRDSKPGVLRRDDEIYWNLDCLSFLMQKENGIVGQLLLVAPEQMSLSPLVPVHSLSVSRGLILAPRSWPYGFATQLHLKLPAADPMAATGKLLANFHQADDRESYTHEPGLTLLPTVAEAELGQRVSHGVCK